MKRENNIFNRILEDENISLAIDEVNKTHRWTEGHKPNRTVLWVETTKPERVQELKSLIRDGFQPTPPRKRRVYDQAAGKWRDICEPKLYPDQYVHHALMQVLQPVMMRRMDKWCCGSIRDRGTHYGSKAIKKWMKADTKGTKYCLELDIRHFYESIQPRFVIDRLRCLIKDHKALALIESLIADGVLIGFYYSQWFANMLLQPLDKLIRNSGFCSHYVRYMDNFSIFGSNKRKLRKLFQLISEWLADHGLAVKDNWQIFKVCRKRIPNALGYRFGREYTLIRKHTLLRIKRKLRSLYRITDVGGRITKKMANGMVSRLGQLKHCNSKKIRENILRQNFVKMLKNIIRKYQKSEVTQWSTALQNYMARKCSGLSPA